jgi:hypothetical protein
VGEGRSISRPRSRWVTVADIYPARPIEKQILRII